MFQSDNTPIKKGFKGVNLKNDIYLPEKLINELS